MGNNNTRPIRFLQSSSDFPCPVSLGENAPSFGLYRFNKALRFVPPDDEGFTLRGDKKQLVYKGRRRSHRFTILGDTAFEYDCILEREPESNVVSLFMEGAESFDFFRQPDFVPDPFMKGSYAVYKKETLLGEGTGKLCHIHRPLIIDAMGRRVWGDLSIEGNCLFITIPEQWLSEAKYPVIVDPTIGTTTIGSQMTGPDPNNKFYDRPWLDGEFAVNKYLVPQNGSGICTAYVYCYHNNTDSYATPILYSNESNKPFMRKSQNERDINVIVGSVNPAGWRSNIFNINGTIAAGENVWFGIFSSYFTTRFDYGIDCYKGWFDWETYEDYEGEPTPYINVGPWVTFCNIKWSWYFNYTAITSQNFVRTLTQGVSLYDNHKLTADYKRKPIETVQVKFAAMRLQAIFRKLQEAVQGLDINSSSFLFFRSIHETAKVSETVRHFWTFVRGLIDKTYIESEVKSGRFYYLKITETVYAAGVVFRGLILYVKIFSQVFVRDYLLHRFLKAREEIVLKSPICREIILDNRID
jgi:hypothetical protein